MEDAIDLKKTTAERLWEKAYAELRRIARRRLQREATRATFDSQELVQETFVRLANQREPWVDDSHLRGVAAMAMGRILVDRARLRGRLKRNDAALPGVEPIPSQHSHPAGEEATDLLQIKDALDRLAEIDERQARVVAYRCIGGLTAEETAEALGVSRRTVDRDWVHAKCWLRRELAQLEGS